jgi:hypothetical protein
MLTLSIAIALFHRFCRNVSIKRKTHPWLLSLLGAVFVSIFFTTGLPIQLLFIIVPFATIFVLINIKKTYFCGACGSTLYNAKPFERMSYCPKCGANLSPDPHGDPSASASVKKWEH